MSSTQQEIKVARKRAGMGAPTVQIQTTPAGSRMSMGVPGMTVRRTTNVLRQSMGPAYVSAPGEATRISKNAVDTICDNRGKEKSEMSELNTRLARHLEETRFHKATIQALTDELQKWKDLKGLDDKRLRDEFVEELREARESLTGLKDTIAEKEARILSLEDMLDTKNAEVDAIKGQREELLAEISRLTNMISGLEGELNSTRRSVENAEREKKLLQEDLARLRADNDRIREDCEAARCKQIEATHQRDALDEQLAFEMESYEIENDSLRELIKELQKMTPKIQEKWSSDFKELVAAIQGDYAERVAIKEDECRRRYEDQLDTMQNNLLRDRPDVGPLKNENKTLKNQLGPLKDKCRKLDDELIMIQNSIPRDNTDQIQKSENKTLKSSLSKNKALISDLERENARLEALLAQIRRERDEECEECERDKARLKAEWDKANDELQQVADTLRTLQDKNLDLELEISCYRKLLEGEERQMARNLEDYSQMQSAGGAMLASAISGGGRGGRGGGSGGGAQTSQSSNPQKDKPITKPAGAGKEPPKSNAPVMSESSGTVRMQRTSRGNFVIRDVDQSGGYISVGTNGSKECNLTGFKLTRMYNNNKKKAEFVFPKNTILKPGKDIRIYASSCDDDKGPGDFTASCAVWGSGNGKCELFDDQDASKATCVITYE